jgi:endonuclease G
MGNMYNYPCIKVVYFQKADNKTYRVGFLLSHHSLLKASSIITNLESESLDDHLFLDFKKAETYQVNISIIENITNMQFAYAVDSYQDTRPIELIFDEIDIDPDLESDSIEQRIGFSIVNLTL